MTGIFSHLFYPNAVAVVGASRSPSKVGHQILKNILDGGFSHPVYPVNPNAKTILNLPVHPTLTHIKGPVDLAVVTTPAPLVESVLIDAMEKQVKAVIIITAGFAESGVKGKELQQRLKQTVSASSLRLLGPNCLGVLNPHSNLNATFGPKLPPKGSLSLISQSGALVTGILDWVNQHGIGLSHAITLGNRLDISENEALKYAFEDPHTHTILTYIESFADAPAFFSLASRITPIKPVILLKGGRSAKGQQASASHTAALASNFTLIKALAEQTGVIVADTIEDWLNLAFAFTKTPPAKGNRLAILTNAGGPGVVATDYADTLGISINPLMGKTIKTIKNQLQLHSLNNPADILGDASPEDFEVALTALNQDYRQDMITTIITPQTTTKPKATAEVIAKLFPSIKKPFYTILLGGQKMQAAASVLKQAQVPYFTYPNEAIDCIAATTHYFLNRRRCHPFPAKYLSPVTIGVKTGFQSKLSGEIDLKSAFALLQAYGLAVPAFDIVTCISQIPEALSQVDRPAVAKTANLSIAHKAKAGGVVTDLMTVHQAQTAYRKLSQLGPEVLIQKTVHGQVELIIGAKRDAQTGLFVTIGLGGAFTNQLQDRQYVFTPAGEADYVEAFGRTKAAAVLADRQLDPHPVVKAMQAVAAIMLDFPQIAEMEINPAILTQRQLFAVDIKITLVNP